MDVGAHNVTLEWIRGQPGGRGHYGAFIFLNSSTRGPFYPSYMPPGWQWTMAFTSLLSASVKVRVKFGVCTCHTLLCKGGFFQVESPCLHACMSLLPLVLCRFSYDFAL